MKKRIAVLALAALCVGLLALPAAAATEYPAWAAGAMERWADCEKLDGGIAAAQPMTYGGAVAVLDKVIAAQAAQGADPAAPLTRQDAAVLVAGLFGFEGAGAPGYEDAAAISPEAAGAVYALQQAGVMQGSGGFFRPADVITYAELVVLADNALRATDLITGMTAQARSAEGVLADGADKHVNDGKFTVGAVTKTEDGYAVELTGTAALVGQKADEVAAGQPQWDGKWMGLCLSFRGLVQADALQYSRDGESWTGVDRAEALVPAIRVNSVMVYVNGAEKPEADGKEIEKTSTVYFRQGDEGKPFTVTFHYTPAK